MIRYSQNNQLKKAPFTTKPSVLITTQMLLQVITHYPLKCTSQIRFGSCMTTVALSALQDFSCITCAGEDAGTCIKVHFFRRPARLFTPKKQLHAARWVTCDLVRNVHCLASLKFETPQYKRLEPPPLGNLTQDKHAYIRTITPFLFFSNFSSGKNYWTSIPPTAGCWCFNRVLLLQMRRR